MIEQNTVFILGAGASKHCSYPLGRELKDSILNQLVDTNSSNTYTRLRPTEEISAGGNRRFNYLKANCNIKMEDIKRFKEDFSMSSLPSIDTFLENRPNYLSLGKRLIAMSIFDCEEEHTLFSAKNSWYRYLMANINRSSEGFKTNKLKIITYNYDRSLEHFLIKDLIHTYEFDANTAIDTLRSTISILHVHGKIADNAWAGGKNYNRTYTTDDIETAANQLYIITEESEVKSRYQEIHETLAKAENVFLLGFGFDERNLQRLELTKCIRHNAKIFATRTGIPDLKVHEISKKHNYRIKFSMKEDHDILEFFNREVSLKGAMLNTTFSYNEGMGFLVY
jgi:hypothetical protein